jgi:hypothetical protein
MTKVNTELKVSSINSIELPSNYNSCFYSSFIFLVNSIVAFSFGYMFYSIIFFILLITSLIMHSTGNIYAIIIDKVAILMVVLYGGYLFYTKCLRPIDYKQIIYMISIVSTFLITIYLYLFGYINRQYCFCSDINLANKYHSLLHMISSIGHNLIIFM